jgi:hypothetical protein
MSLESHAPQFFAAPPTKIDGFPAAVTVDLGYDMSDKGTGIGFDKPWNQATINMAAARTAKFVAKNRVS